MHVRTFGDVWTRQQISKTLWTSLLPAESCSERCHTRAGHKKRNVNSCTLTLYRLSDHPSLSVAVSCVLPILLPLLAGFTFSNMHTVKWINEHWVNFSFSFPSLFSHQQLDKQVVEKTFFVSSARVKRNSLQDGLWKHSLFVSFEHRKLK